MWADSEGYIGDKPVPEPIQKLVVSPGNLCGTGHGRKTLADAFMSLLVGLGRASFASAIVSLPPLFRRALAEDNAARSEPCATSAAFALCDSHGGAVFDPRHGYEPRVCDAWSSPRVGHGAPATAHDVLTIAQAQIVVIRDEVAPAASGGQLVVAKILADRVVKTTVQLLVASERRSLSLGDTLAHRAARLAAIERARSFP
jgi:hypothetical protein